MHRPTRRIAAAIALFATTALTVPAAVTLPATAGTPAGGPTGGSTPACTITGTARNDRLVGTPRADVICGLGGNDTLVGLGGNDILVGGPGNDTLDGGSGRDVLTGDVGRDRLTGGPGDDTLTGGYHSDQLRATTSGDSCSDDPADTVTGSCTTDTTGPVISDVTVTGAAAGSTLTVTMRVSDPSGLYQFGDGDAATMTIAGAPGAITEWCGFNIFFSRISGSPTDGVYQATCTIPADALNGDYSLFIAAVDTHGNSSEADPVTFTIANGSDDSYDTSPPVISDITVTGAAAGSTLTVTMRVSDPSGLYQLEEGDTVTMMIGGAPGWITRWCGFVIFFSRISGSPTDGIYQATCTIPADAVNGQYTLFIGAVDTRGNRGEADPVTFTIANGSNDASPPAISDLTLSGEVFAPGDDITLTFRVTDETGVAYAGPWAFGPNRSLVDFATGQPWLGYGLGTLVAGDARDGTYRVTLRLSEQAIAGTYTLWFSLGDTLGNRSFSPAGAGATFSVAA